MNTAEAYGLLGAAPWPTAAQGKRQEKATGQPLPAADIFVGAQLAELATAEGLFQSPIPNDFEPILFQRFPMLSRARNTLLRGGAKWAALTGSGSAIFGMFPSRAQAAAAQRKLDATGMRLFLCRTVRRRDYQAGCAQSNLHTRLHSR